MKNPLFNRDLLSVAEFSLDEINLILNTAQAMKQNKVADCLRGKLLASCFFEPSTRTRLSFEASMQRLGGAVIGFADEKMTSSQKSESLSDSMTVISQYADAIVLRHPAEGSARLAAQASNKPIINAGDGANRHPSQTLLDLFSIRECQQSLDNLQIAFVGDLKYSRTVHSLTQTCARYHNNRFYFVSPEMLTLPDYICNFLKTQQVRFSFHHDIESIIDKVDILYMTRMQRERFDDMEFRNLQQHYQLTPKLLRSVKESMKIMHPLPRVDEISTDIDNSPHAYYFQQASNGLYTRQAILALLLSEEYDV